MSKDCVVITGAAGGIGTELCRTFRREGYKVIGVDQSSVIDADEAIIFNLNDAVAQCESLKQSLDAVIGTDVLCALINNAAWQVVKSFPDLTPSDWDRTLHVNLTAPMILSQLLLERLASAGGHILNIASIHAHLTKPGFVAYATSKAALLGFTQALAVDLGGRVHVNAILPAAIRTPMLEAGFSGQPERMSLLENHHPTGCIGTPRELAELAAFIVSGKMPFMNGAAINLDGGIGHRLHDPV